MFNKKPGTPRKPHGSLLPAPSAAELRERAVRSALATLQGPTPSEQDLAFNDEELTMGSGSWDHILLPQYTLRHDVLVTLIEILQQLCQRLDLPTVLFGAFYNNAAALAILREQWSNGEPQLSAFWQSYAAKFRGSTKITKLLFFHYVESPPHYVLFEHPFTPTEQPLCFEPLHSHPSGKIDIGPQVLIREFFRRPRKASVSVENLA